MLIGELRPQLHADNFTAIFGFARKDRPPSVAHSVPGFPPGTFAHPFGPTAALRSARGAFPACKSGRNVDLDQWWPLLAAYVFDRRQARCMYKHILIPTDGSELSKVALEEGVALAKALDASVTIITVTTPFHVITGSPVMLTDTPGRYKEHMTAIAGHYLDEGKKIAAAAGVECDLAHVEHEHPYKAIIDTTRTEL